MENSNSKRTIVILGVVLTLAVLLGGYLWNQNNALNTSNEELQASVTELNDIKDDLLGEINDLQTSYDELNEEYLTVNIANDSLTAIYQEASKSVAQKRAEIKTIKDKANADVKGLREQIAALKAIKADMSKVIDDLQKDNLRLTGEVKLANLQNERLKGEIAEMKQLNLAMQKELAKLAAANSRVTNMRVDVKKANDKITSSRNRAREIVVSFDLKNLPKDKLKEDRLYLVITDAKGTPVKVKNPISTTIRPNTGGDAFPIIAQQTIRQTLQNGARLQFIQPLDEKLRGGAYRVSVYADWGLLGSASFQLR